MTRDSRPAGEREAERLRSVLETMAHAHPGMALDEAVPIKAIEEVRSRTTFGGVGISLKDAKNGVLMWMKGGYLAESGKDSGSTPSAAMEISDWIDTQEDIVELIKDGKKIHAIKETRFRHPGCPELAEAQAGVYRWIAMYDS